ncbi:MAG: type II toxin-antitoxin system RelE/ParE family toxin [Burkholderiaceae bacterium]|jgi:putative addiction module killer protein|nr:type II toxin-antitoxin system RelE/ParE family toxin [Burkholderiaceae bacterium]
MFQIESSETFLRWLNHLRDLTAKGKIQARIRRASMGNMGDVGPIEGVVSEMRIDHGPGYRVYFMQEGANLIVLLCGGDKSTQSVDIARAKTIAAEYKRKKG